MECAGDGAIPRTVADGCQGFAPADDSVADVPGAGTVVRLLLLAQGWPGSAVAGALERDPYTIGRWAAAFGEGGPTALIFEQSGGSPPPSAGRSRRI